MTAGVAKAAFHRSIPIMAGYMVLGLGFGILMDDNGFSPVWTFLMSFIVYSSSTQFVGVSLLSSGASVLTTALTALMVGARYMFCSLSMVSRYRGAGKKKFYLFCALTDETYSIVSDDTCPDGEDPNTYRFLISFFDQIYWLTGSLAGAFVGKVIPFNTEGIGFAMTALFVTIFVEEWMKTKQHIPAILGIVATAACRVIFGSEVFMIPSMTVILLTLVLMHRRFGQAAADDAGGHGNERV